MSYLPTSGRFLWQMLVNIPALSSIQGCEELVDFNGRFSSSQTMTNHFRGYGDQELAQDFMQDFTVPDAFFDPFLPDGSVA